MPQQSNIYVDRDIEEPFAPPPPVRTERRPSPIPESDLQSFQYERLLRDLNRSPQKSSWWDYLGQYAQNYTDPVGAQGRQLKREGLNLQRQGVQLRVLEAMRQREVAQRAQLEANEKDTLASFSFLRKYAMDPNVSEDEVRTMTQKATPYLREKSRGTWLEAYLGEDSLEGLMQAARKGVVTEQDFDWDLSESMTPAEFKTTLRFWNEGKTAEGRKLLDEIEERSLRMRVMARRREMETAAPGHGNFPVPLEDAQGVFKLSDKAAAKLFEMPSDQLAQLNIIPTGKEAAKVREKGALTEAEELAKRRAEAKIPTPVKPTGATTDRLLAAGVNPLLAEKGDFQAALRAEEESQIRVGKEKAEATGLGVAKYQEQLRLDQPIPPDLRGPLMGAKTVREARDMGFDVPAGDRESGYSIGASKRVQTFREQRKFVHTAVGRINQIQQVLMQNPEAFGASGALAASVEGIAAQVRNFARLAGIEVSVSGVRAEDFQAFFSQAGIKNRMLQSQLIGLAFLAAAAEGLTGRELSNWKVEQIMRQLQPQTQSPETFAATLQQYKHALVGRYFTDSETTFGRPVRDPDLLDATQIRSPEEVHALVESGVLTREQGMDVLRRRFGYK